MSIRKSVLCVMLVGCLAGGMPHAFAQEYYTNNDFPTPTNYPSTSQAVFWISGHTLPEQTVVFDGAFSSAPKQVAFAPLAGYLSLSAALSSTNVVTVPATSMGATGLSATLPALLNTNTSFPVGPFAYQITDSSGWTNQGAGNQPTIYWVEGIPSSYSQTTEPLHQVLTGEGELNQTLRIFGRDFPSYSWVAITVNGSTRWYNPYTTDPYELDIDLTNEPTGTGTIQVGFDQSTPRDATFGPGVPITIAPASTMTSATYTCSNLVGDGETDNTANLQADLNNNIPATNTAEYITIPTAGTYNITNSITLNPHQYLVGGTSGVVISGTVTGTNAPPSNWITGSSYFGLLNIGVRAPLGTAYEDSIISDGTSTGGMGGHVILSGLTLTAENGNGNNSFDVCLSGPDIQVVDSTLNGAPTGTNTGLSLAILYGNGVLVSTDTFNLGACGWNTVSCCQDVIVENSDFQPNAGVTNVPSAVSFVSGSSQLGTTNGWSTEQNIYAGNNYLANMPGNSANNTQSFMEDGRLCTYEGLISSCSGTIMTLMNSPVWTQHSYYYAPSQCIVSILAGTGQGQYQQVVGASGNTITLSHAWAVAPDSTSVVCIGGNRQNQIFYGNYITNAGPIEMGAAENMEMANNTIINSAGIQFSSGPYFDAYEPIIRLDIHDNQLTGSFSRIGYPTENNGIYMTGFSDGIISGTSIRGNIGDANAFDSTNSGFLLFDQGGWADRICSLLEEGESSPTGGSTNGVSAIKEENYNPMVVCKENALTANQYLTGLTTTTGTGWYGMQFTVGSRPITVTQLGRWVVSGNSQGHTVELFNSSYQAIAGGSVTVNTSGETKGAFAYVPLTNPIELQPFTTYYLESQENTDSYYTYSSSGPNICPSTGVTVNAAAVGQTLYGSANNSYGPVSLTFNQEMSMVESAQLGTLQGANVDEWCGCEFTVGPDPITVSELGRWVCPGNTGSHPMQIFNSSYAAVSGTATVNTAGVAAGQFAYAPLPTPVTLSANTTYILESYETPGGDQFYNVNNTFVIPGAGVTPDGGIYDDRGGNDPAKPNYTYGPVSMLFSH